LGFATFNSGPDLILIVAVDFLYQITQVAHAAQCIGKIAVMHTYAQVISVPDQSNFHIKISWFLLTICDTHGKY
jgi:hypothetical protein